MSKAKKKAKWLRRMASKSPTWMVAGCAGVSNKPEFQAYRDRGFLSQTTQHSTVRRIDPATGLVISQDEIEVLGTQFLKEAERVKRQPKKRQKRKGDPSPDRRETFFRSWEWRTLRMEVLKERGRTCMCCGATAADKTPDGKRIRIQVDHIKPISRYWHLRAKKSNLQVLCDECNQGKGAWDETDYRGTSQPFAEADELTREYRDIVGPSEVSNVTHLPARATRQGEAA